MFKKISNIKLFIIFIILLSILIVVSIIDNKKGGRSFKENLIENDTSEFTRIEIVSNINGNEAILEKFNDSWFLLDNGKKYSTDKAKINIILGYLTKLKPTGVVSDQKKSWGEYNVTDTSGTIIKLFVKRKKVSEIIIGRSEYNAPKDPTGYFYVKDATMSFKTFIRPVKDRRVYTISALLSLSFSDNKDEFRNHIVSRIDPGDLVKISFSYPADSSFILNKKNEKWYLNDLLIDSLNISKYLNTLKKIDHFKYVSDLPVGDPELKIILEGDNIVQPIELSAFDVNNQQVVNSSLNPDAYFDGKESDLFSKIFIGKEELIKE